MHSCVEEELENEANLLKQLGEGCNIVGVLTIKKVPGNFHISTHAHSDLMKKVIKKEDLNLSHVIHHLSFGPAVDVHGVDAAFAPLNGMRRIISQEVQAPLPSFEYYIKMVPTIYEQLNGDVVRTHQFTSNSNMVFYTHPVVFFRFDISPITVKFTDTRQPFLHFVVQLCAIVGGVVTVLGMSSRILHRSISSVLAKARYGKLG